MTMIPDYYKSRQKIAMSEKVGRELKELQFTACVHLNERILIAKCKIYKLMFPEDTEFIEFLDKVGIPALIELGRQKWYRDQITDLGLALSGRDRGGKAEDTSDILEGLKLE